MHVCIGGKSVRPTNPLRVHAARDLSGDARALSLQFVALSFEIPSRPPVIAGHVGSSCRLRRSRSFDCMVRCGTARLDPGAIPLVMDVNTVF